VISASFSVWFDQNMIEPAARHEDKTLTPDRLPRARRYRLRGVTMTIFGERLKGYSRGLSDRKKNITDYLIFGLFFLPGIIAFYLLYEQLAQLGYHYR